MVGAAGLTAAGFTEQMLLGKTPQEVFLPEMAARTVAMAGKTLAGESLVYEETYAGCLPVDATRHLDALAIDPTALAGAQECHHAADVFGPAHPVQRG